MTIIVFWISSCSCFGCASRDQSKEMLGASLVKYTTLLPYICLNESDSTLYIIFEFCEGKNHKHLRTHWSIKPSNLR